MLTLAITSALLLDHALGEARRFHPLVGFGAFAQAMESLARRIANAPRLHRQPVNSAALLLLLGGLACAVSLVPLALFVAWVFQTLAPQWQFPTAVLLLYFCLGRRSLAEHAAAVAKPLQDQDVTTARDQLAFMVSRDTESMTEAQISAATIESVLENGNDACFATIFWFAVAGPAGCLVHRLVNTLDAMWGYQNVRYLYFGRCAARLDDAMNAVPAVFSALAYALCGGTKAALECWRTQAPACASPNAGAVMAAGAGALGIRIGGSATYAGVPGKKPVLGCGEAATSADIERASRLLSRSLVLWLLSIALWELIPWY